MTQKESPEVAGLLAANSGFALLQGTLLPGPRPISRALLRLLAVASFGVLAVAVGATVADNGASRTAVVEAPASQATSPILPASSIAQQAALEINPAVQTVVLRGQPFTKVGRHL